MASNQRVVALSLTELSGEPWVVNPSDNVVGSYFADVFHRHGLELPPRRVVTFSLDVRMHLLATGRYLTILSRTVMLYNSERWSLRRLPIDLQIPDMPIAVFTLKGRTVSPVVKLYIEHVRMQAKSGLRLQSIGESTDCCFNIGAPSLRRFNWSNLCRVIAQARQSRLPAAAHRPAAQYRSRGRRAR